MPAVIEWNRLIKPLLYLLNLCLGAVIAFGTADRLLYVDPVSLEICCSYGNSIAICTVVILVGFTCMALTLFALWRRFMAAFVKGESYANTDEAMLNACVAIIWAILTVLMLAAGDGGLVKSRNGQRRTTIVIAAILTILQAFTAALTWVVPDKDVEGEAERLLAAGNASSSAEVGDAGAGPSSGGGSSSSSPGPAQGDGQGENEKNVEGGAGGNARHATSERVETTVSNMDGEGTSGGSGATHTASGGDQVMIDAVFDEEVREALPVGDDVEKAAEAWRSVVTSESVPATESPVDAEGVSMESGEGGTTDREFRATLRRRTLSGAK